MDGSADGTSFDNAQTVEGFDASLGLVYKVSERLCTEGFAEKERRFGIRLSDPSGLLDTWREEYDFVGLNQVYSFHSPERSPDRLMDRIRSAAEMLGAGYGLTLHAGASLVAPHVRFSDVHFYFDGDLDTWVDAVGLSLVEMGGNTHLIKPYDAGAFYAKHDVGGRSVVANVQLYLDLWKYPARCRQQAQYLREDEIRYRGDSIVAAEPIRSGRGYHTPAVSIPKLDATLQSLSTPNETLPHRATCSSK